MRGRFAALVLGLILTSTAIQGKMDRFINPFDGMARAKLSIVVGGPLDVQGGPNLRLFGGDHERARRFRTHVTESVARRLQDSGIMIDDKVDDEISIRVYGREERDVGCRSRYIFLVQVNVFNSRLDEAMTQGSNFPLRPVIGLSDDSALDETLVETVWSILDNELNRPRTSNPAKPATGTGRE